MTAQASSCERCDGRGEIRSYRKLGDYNPTVEPCPDCQPKPSEGTVSETRLNEFIQGCEQRLSWARSMGGTGVTSSEKADAECASIYRELLTARRTLIKLRDKLPRMYPDLPQAVLSDIDATIERQAGEIETLHARNQSRELRIAELEADLAAARLDRDGFVEKAATNMRLYMDLLMQVVHVVPGETRHESAKRIINQHENQSHGPACAAIAAGDGK